ncbi:cation diffusion facilitator family transporter [Aristaeella hokkaidonensis]|uniref:Cation transporter n=1 Tax=Aristaeella hokkaidonensis TaxID=3046382 RepID=A0AC61MWL0_9FIRM|nr:cation diffusion facilitator family transporter [Aristaeella hokkaidonensis]QTE72193.1 cation transporter [Clostridiales bacterium FE2011]QTE73181.1 cation transporter [Clostridiales bacterium FE2010]QUC67160.1 cation transporter [Aristaeella hokkaidonensis]SNT93528.1 cation diffusion facilitator family transporter [Aristaeella hokkaidonensis]
MAEKKAEEFQTAATRVSLVSMITNVILTLLKLAAGLLAHSGAMISDAVHSASDIFSGLIVLLGVKISTKEPDEQHPYGHERYECVAALLLSGILAVVGGAIGIGAVKDIISGKTAEIPGLLALIAAVVSIAVKESLFWYTRGYAKKYRSTALHAEAWHQRSDALSSIGALIGIAGARMGVPVMEPIASLIIALFILRVAIRIFKEAIDQMVDHSCNEEAEEAFRTTALEQPGVMGVELLRTRMFGNRVYVDLEIAADPNLTLAAAHEIAEDVHDAIEKTFPEVKHIMVHVNPAKKHD